MRDSAGTLRRTRWCPVVLVFLGCVGARSAPSSAPDDQGQILEAVGDTLLPMLLASRDVAAPFYARRTTSARALEPAARRAAVRLSMAPDTTWCDDPARTGRSVGTVVALQIDVMTVERAEVRWSATCLTQPRGGGTPHALGESGVYEVVAGGGEWRVSRALLHVVY